MDCVKEYRKGIGIFWRSNIYSKVYDWRYNCWTRYIGSGRPTLNFQIMIYVGGKNLGTIPVVGYYDHISYLGEMMQTNTLMMEVHLGETYLWAMSYKTMILIH